jgi:AcrR family transcriptional regulator
VAAARALFGERGYRGATVRAIAAAAGVDQALISYHFGSKQGLFAQALQLPCADPAGLDAALTGPVATLADRLLDALCRQWDPAEPTETCQLALDETTVRALRDYLDGHLRVRIAEFLHGPHARARATAAVGVLGGVLFTRYLSPLPTIAGLSAQQTRHTFGPALRAALTTAAAPPPIATAISRGFRPE